MSGHVFISHSSENRDEANDLAAFIEGHGVKTWIAPRDVRPGMDYSEQLQEAIEQCVAFVVLVTEMANTSPYVRAETEMAFSNHKPIFPVRNFDIKPAAGLAFFLKIRHWTDAFGKYRDAAMDRLALELKTVCGVPLDEQEKTRLALEPSPGPGTTPPVTAPPVAPPVTPESAAPAPIQAPPEASTPAPAPTTPPVQPMPLTSPPVTSPPVTAPPLPPPDDEQLAAAVGPNADKYIARWRAMDAKGSKVSWSWAACLANMFWLAYRKMWLGMALFLVATLVLGVIGSANPTAARVTLVLNILMTFVTGYFGVHFYRLQTERLVAQSAGLDRPAALDMLRKRGGVSKPAVFILIGLIALFTLWAVLKAAVERQQLLQQQNNIVAPVPGADKPPVDPNSVPVEPDPNAPVDEQQAPQDQAPPADQQPQADQTSY